MSDCKKPQDQDQEKINHNLEAFNENISNLQIVVVDLELARAVRMIRRKINLILSIGGRCGKLLALA